MKAALATLAAAVLLSAAAPAPSGDPELNTCQHGRGDEATAACQHILKTSNGELDREGTARFGLARLQTEAGHIDEAITNITEGIKHYPKAAGFYRMRGRLYGMKNEDEKALADLNISISLNSKEPLSYIFRGEVYARQKNYAAAIQDADKAISLNTAIGEAYWLRGTAHLVQHDIDASISDFNQAIHLNPQDANSYTGRALAYRGKKDFDHAIADGLKAANLAPDDWNILNALSAQYLFSDRRDDLATFDRLVHEHPEAAAPYYFRAKALWRQDRLKDAIADLDVYVSRAPENEMGYRSRGMFLELDGQYEKAAADFGQALKYSTEPRMIAANYEDRCVSRAEAGVDLDAGISDCNRTLRMDDGRWDGYLGRGFLEFRQKKYAAALADFDKRINVQVKPDSLTERALNSFTNLMLGRSLNDPPFYMKGGVLGTGLATAFCGRAMTKARMGDATGAAEDFASANKLDAESVGKCKRLYGSAH